MTILFFFLVLKGTLSSVEQFQNIKSLVKREFGSLGAAFYGHYFSSLSNFQGSISVDISTNI